jgi:predicted ATPase
MLIEFRVENHRSIRDEQVFTMEAGRTSDPDALHVRHVAGHKEALLTVAAFYGANASGKSNLLSALMFMREAVTDSHRLWEPSGGFPRDPFAWGKHHEQPSLYEVTFVRHGTRYRYGFVVDSERVLEEWLFAWPGTRKQVWFEREQAFKFGEHLKGENRTIEQLTRTNALFLSVAAQHGHKQLQEVYAWIAALIIDVPPPVGCESPEFDPQTINNTEATHWVKRMMQVADVGISDLRFHGDLRHPTLQFLHKSESADAWLPWYQESEGTRNLLIFANSVLAVLSSGSVLIVDELERSLHPLLAVYIIRWFKDPLSNPKHAQLIFTTHDTNLLGTSLGEPALSRDQVWLTEKDEFGASVIYPLSDYKPRKAENVERGYLQGRYGAIPFLGSIENLVDP